MQRKRILIVDDEKGFTAMLKLNLEASGKYEVCVENKSVRAVNTARNFHPELVLLDIIMPEKEGPDVAVEMRATYEFKHTPIVFLTATITKEEAHQGGGRIGGHTFVAKPSNLTELMQSIEENLIQSSLN